MIFAFCCSLLKTRLRLRLFGLAKGWPGKGKRELGLGLGLDQDKGTEQFLSFQLWHSQQFAMAIFLQTTHMHFNVCFGFWFFF